MEGAAAFLFISRPAHLGIEPKTSAFASSASGSGRHDRAGYGTFFSHENILSVKAITLENLNMHLKEYDPLIAL